MYITRKELEECNYEEMEYEPYFVKWFGDFSITLRTKEVSPDVFIIKRMYLKHLSSGTSINYFYDAEIKSMNDVNRIEYIIKLTYNTKLNLIKENGNYVYEDLEVK